MLKRLQFIGLITKFEYFLYKVGWFLKLTWINFEKPFQNINKILLHSFIRIKHIFYVSIYFSFFGKLFIYPFIYLILLISIYLFIHLLRGSVDECLHIHTVMEVGGLSLLTASQICDGLNSPYAIYKVKVGHLPHSGQG